MDEHYLIYHSKRKKSSIDNLLVHHDSFGGNEDPYLWHDQFLHSYCHITQLPKIKGQINFWLTGDKYPDFTELKCDCVFVTKDIFLWTEANQISQADPIIDSKECYDYHYKWHHQHYFKKRDRYTLKADSVRSFQPQDANKELIDIIPFLNSKGITTPCLISSIAKTKNDKRAWNSRPFKLEGTLGQELYDYLFTKSPIKIFGKQLSGKRP